MAEFSFMGDDPETAALRKLVTDLQTAAKQQTLQANLQKQLAVFALEAADGGPTGGFLDDLAADSNSQDARLTALEQADSTFGTLMDIAKMGVQIYTGGIPMPGGQ